MTASHHAGAGPIGARAAGLARTPDIPAHCRVPSSAGAMLGQRAAPGQCRCSASSRTSAGLGRAPTIVLDELAAGADVRPEVEVMPCVAAVRGFSSMFTSTTPIASAWSAAISSTIGAIWRHEGHQGAQRSAGGVSGDHRHVNGLGLADDLA